MSLLLNRAKMTTATTGTGTVTLGSAVSPYQTWAAALALNALVYDYLIEDGTDWELGHGTYTTSGTTLSRNLDYSSTGSLLNLSGSATVACVEQTSSKSQAGAAFPTSPVTNQRVYRTDRGIEYYYDGTRWLSTEILTLPIALPDNLNPVTVNTQHRAVNPWWNIYDIYVLTLQAFFYNTAATVSSNYYTYQLQSSHTAGNTNVGSSFNGSGDTQSTFTGHSVTVNAVVASTEIQFQGVVTKTGSPSLYFGSSINYRLVG